MSKTKTIEYKDTWYKRLKDKVYDFFNVYRQIRLDSQYHQEFVNGMKSLAEDPSSEFSKYNLVISEDGEKITYVTKLPNEFRSATEYMIYDKLNEITTFITQYLRYNVGLNMYISIPDYYRVEDPTEEDISLTYISEWHFQPMVDKKMKRKYEFIKYSSISGLTAAVAGAAAWLICL